MYISGNNIIRFPVQPVTPVRAERAEEDSEKIVGFPVPEVSETAEFEMQERGQVFAAHRIVARVVDQLDAVAAL